MARYVELRRHTDNEGDVLTAEGVRAALDIGTGVVIVADDDGFHTEGL